MRLDVRHRTAAGLLAALGALAIVAPAHATGYCGSDLTQATACGIPLSPTTVTGSIASTVETDWFVFWARHQTNVSVTVTDTEDPSCSDPTGGPSLCGSVGMSISGRNGDSGPSTGTSSPGGGQSDPESFTDIVGPGVYYLEVYGTPELSGAPVPYSVSVNGSTSPTVRWPPLCVVPRLRSKTSLSRAKAALTHARCAPGRVTHAYSTRVPRGRVIRLRTAAGRGRPEYTKIGLVVSRGRRRHH